MTIGTDTRKRWKKLREHGVIRKIEKETQLSRPTIINALKTGEMSIKTFEKLSAFFNELEKTTSQ